MSRRRRRARNEGTIYRRGAGWAIKWRADGLRRTRGGFESREAAAAVLARVTSLARIAERDRDLGRPPPLASFPTLEELAGPWLARREKTHRAGRDDGWVWRRHVAAFFGGCRPAEVDAARIRAFVEAKLAEGLNPATVQHHFRLLSTFYSDLVERPRETGVSVNVCRTVPRSTRRLMKPTYDSRTTPFIETLDDVRRVFRALPDPFGVAFAVGALAGLRTAEVLGVSWPDVDLGRRQIRVHQQVQDSRLQPLLKDGEARIVPVLDSLAPILAAYRLQSGGEGLLFQPDRPGRAAGRGTGSPSTFVAPQTLHKHLRAALDACGLRRVTWYQATRHTFASQWVMGNGSIEKLAAVLGHSSTWVTQRYAHLRPDLFRPDDFARLPVDLLRGGAEVVSMPVGPPEVHGPAESAAHGVGIG